MIRFSKPQGLAKARARFARVRGALLDFRSLHEKTGQELEKWVSRNFAARGALLNEFSSGWPPLARATLAARRRRQGTKPLQVSGKLLAGITLEAGARSAVLDNPVPYASAHQTGAGVPRRPFFPSAAQAGEIVFPVAARHIREVLA